MQIGDFEIGAALCRIDDQGEIRLREFADQLAYHRGRGIAGIGNAEDQLERRIVLAQKGAQILGQRRILAA